MLMLLFGPGRAVAAELLQLPLDPFQDLHLVLEKQPRVAVKRRGRLRAHHLQLVGVAVRRVLGVVVVLAAPSCEHEPRGEETDHGEAKAEHEAEALVRAFHLAAEHG